MSAPSLLLRLPLELLVKVIQHCEQYDWPEDPNAEHIESSHDPREYNINDKHHTPWITATNGAVQDICSIRRVCREMRIASNRSFATIIGSRRFRFTGTGLADLKAISQDPLLAPWIKTLTFANTDFTEWKCRAPGLGSHEHISPGAGTLAYRDTAEMDKFVKAFKALPIATVETELSNILPVFHQLATLRIAAPVVDLRDYSIAWIKSDGQLCTAMKHDNEAPGQQLEFLDDISIDHADQEEYVTGCSEIANTVLTVLSKAGIHLQDYRVCSTFDPSGFQHNLLPDALRTLRITVHESDFRTVSLFIAALAKTTNLEDLGLVLRRSHPFGPQDAYPKDLSWERESKAVFRAVQNTRKLRRVELAGDWAYNEDSLIDFVKQHASSLRCLILYGGVLYEFWLQTLHRLADLSRDGLEYLSIKFMYDIRQDWTIEYEYLDHFGAWEWPQFGCATDFGPKFRLIEYEDETYEEDEEMEDAEDDDDSDGDFEDDDS